MKTVSPREIHNLSAAIQKIYGFIELAESSYDFSSPTGQSITEAAREAILLLQSQIQVLNPAISEHVEE